VFYPSKVSYYGSKDGKTFKLLKEVLNKEPLHKKSVKNDIQFFQSSFSESKIRFIKLKATNLKVAPYWHHAAGLPSWVFLDEIIVE
jgi:hypothetical protein